MSGVAEPSPTDPSNAPTSVLSDDNPSSRATEWVTNLSAVVVVLAGLLVVLIAYGISLLAFDNGSDVGTALAPITGVIGTIVGAYFGIQAGAAGKAEAEAARTKAEGEAKALAAVASPQEAERILRDTGSLPRLGG